MMNRISRWFTERKCNVCGQHMATGGRITWYTCDCEHDDCVEGEGEDCE